MKRALAFLVVMFSAAGCGTAGTESTFGPHGHSDDVASAGFDLDLGGGLTFRSVSYDISRGAFHKTGSADISNSSTVSVLVDAIPIGTGYSASLSASSTDSPPTVCTGTAPFDVAAGGVTFVPVHMACTIPEPAPPVPVSGAPLAGMALLLAGIGLTVLRSRPVSV